MLRRKPATRPTASAYSLRRQCNRYFTLILATLLIVFVLTLTQLHFHSARDVEFGNHKPEPKPPPWEDFPILERYFGGIKSLIPASKNKPEYPGNEEDLVEEIVEALQNASHTSHDGIAKRERSVDIHSVPTSRPYTPILSKNTNKTGQCFLDVERRIPVPTVHTYEGIISGFPDAVLGSQNLAPNTTEATCFDRFGKLGPYGFGYSRKSGGTGAGLEGDRSGADLVWQGQAKIDFRTIDWAKAQRLCADANQGDAAKTAVVIRTQSDYHYGPEDVLNLRAIISEMSLATGAQYEIHFLIEVRDPTVQIWSDEATYARVLSASLPQEFRGMGTLWSAQQMALIYPSTASASASAFHSSNSDHNALMALQHFAHTHPHYAFIWNWHLDVCYTGHLGQLVRGLSTWAANQPRKELWERNSRFYIPSEHGTWDDFTHMVRVQSEHGTSAQASIWSKAGGVRARLDDSNPAAVAAAEKPVWGPRRPAWEEPDTTHDMAPPVPQNRDKYEWGVGEAADLLTLNPIFDPDGTSLSSASDVVGYNTTSSYPPLRASLGSTMRLSARLLDNMHHESASSQHVMAAEMWPASVALHHGFKAVYVPHPVYVDRKWPTDYLAAVFNNGVNGASGGARGSVWGETRQHNLKSLSWGTEHGRFAETLWKRWLGYRVDGRGGERWETEDGGEGGKGEGRMCLPPVLLWPVSGIELVVE